MKLIGSGTGNDVNHAPGGLPIFRRVTVGNDLEFLHRFLRNGRADPVGRIVNRIGAIHIHQVRARRAAR